MMNINSSSDGAKSDCFMVLLITPRSEFNLSIFWETSALISAYLSTGFLYSTSSTFSQFHSASSVLLLGTNLFDFFTFVSELLVEVVSDTGF